eukprot:6190754-Amphidinium_carterae.1
MVLTIAVFALFKKEAPGLLLYNASHGNSSATLLTACGVGDTEGYAVVMVSRSTNSSQKQAAELGKHNHGEFEFLTKSQPACFTWRPQCLI